MHHDCRKPSLERCERHLERDAGKGRDGAGLGVDLVRPGGMRRGGARSFASKNVGGATFERHSVFHEAVPVRPRDAMCGARTKAEALRASR